MSISSPTARYVIAADDQTKAAIASIRSNFKSLDSGVRTVARGINLSLGVLAGVGLKSLFRNVLDATAEAAGKQSDFANALTATKEAAQSLMAAKTGLPAATESLKELTSVLKDPAVLSAADALMSTLVTAFAKTAEFAAKTVAGMRIILTGAGGHEQTDRDMKADRLTAERDSILASSHNNPLGPQRDRIREINHELTVLQQHLDQVQLAPVDNTGQQVLNEYFDRYEEGLKRQVELAKLKKEAEDEAFDRSFDALRAQMAVQKEIDDSVKKSLQDTASATEDVNKILVEATSETMDKVKEAFTETSEYAKEAARNMQGYLADFLFDPFADGLDGMLRGFIDVIRRMISEAAAADIFDAITGGAGGNLSKIFKGVGAFFGGFRAEGGPVAGGRSYVVGERGPELFTPGGGGFITPNGGGRGGVTVAPTYNIDARGATTDLVKALPGIFAANNRQVVEMCRAAIKDDISRGAMRT